MVRILLLAVMLMDVSFALCGDIVDIRQCMNTNLTTEVLSRFPTNATTSVQNCVLFFVRGSVEGNLRTFLTPFSREMRVSEFGVSDLNDIPLSMKNEFSALMSSVSNCVSQVGVYSETTNSGHVRCDLEIQRRGENYNRSEIVHLDIVQTNSFWQIINWDVDE